MGAFIVRIGFWGRLYISYIKEPQGKNTGTYAGPNIKTLNSLNPQTYTPELKPPNHWTPEPLNPKWTLNPKRTPKP